MTIPSQIGRYRILDVLGRGAMGVVYRGVDEALDRQVAVKVMSEGAGADADARARFKREAQAAARLQHPNIVTIYELGEHEGAPYMALELLEGVDLQQAIEAGIRPDPKVTLPVVLQALAGLGHAHDHGIVHRDVKPSNVFLPVRRPAKIMDFGVARLGEAMTSTGLMIGTPNYMSPEQVRAGPLDGRSDLFSAGLILYELVTGEKAFRGDSVVGLLYKIAHEDPDLSLIPAGPGWTRLRAVLERALAKDPDRRYLDADAMSADLVQALLELGGAADWATATDLGRKVKPAPRPGSMALGTEAPPAAAPMALGTAPRAEPAGAAGEQVPPAVPPSLWPILAGGLALAIVVVLAAGWMLLRRDAFPRPAAPTTATSPGPAPAPASSAAVPTPTAASPVAMATRPVAPSPPPATVPAATSTPEPLPSTASVDKANDDLEKRRYAPALAEARAVLKRDPGNAEARTIAEEAEAALVIEDAVQRAREALRKGNKEEAMAALKLGLAVNGNEARLIALWREATQ